MKHLFLFFLFATGFAFNGSAQAPGYNDLIIYFADGNYEKLVDKANKYMSNDKTKRDALPYLYAAKGNFEMSKDQKYEEDFPKAYNNAIGNAGKALKKDKEGTIFNDHEEFYTELKTSVFEEIENMVDSEDFSRMRGKVMKLQRLDPSDVGSYFLLAAAKYQIKDKSGAKISLKEANLRLDAIESVEAWRDIDLAVLRVGIIQYSVYLVKMRQCSSAKDLLNKVKQWFESDEIFMDYYDEIVNSGC